MILPTTSEAKGRAAILMPWASVMSQGGPHGNAHGGFQRGLPQQMRENGRGSAAHRAGSGASRAARKRWARQMGCL